MIVRTLTARWRRVRPVLLVAVPTGSKEAVQRISAEADEVICLDTPAFFMAVGSHYERFDQTTDLEVRQLLDRAWREDRKPAGGQAATAS